MSEDHIFSDRMLSLGPAGEPERVHAVGEDMVLGHGARPPSRLAAAI